MNDSRHEIAERTVERLRQFTERLKSGEPIQATRVTRFDTPDGPMHSRERVVLRSFCANCGREQDIDCASCRQCSSTQFQRGYAA